MTPHARRQLGANVRNTRLARNMKAGKLATASGVARQMISSIENGRNGSTVTTICKLAYALQVPVAHLFQHC